MDVNGLYRLPWTAQDNPNGWIEVTTFCQLKCPGCYRGLAEDSPTRAHEPFERMTTDIDRLIKERNIQTLSIAGGEPLMYPQIKEIIAYAAGKGLKTKIFTNGVALTKERLLSLKEAGATEFIIHTDRFQQRPDAASSRDVRERFCRLFREVGGVNLGFILPVAAGDYAELEETAALCRQNADVVNLFVLTPYKDMLPGPSISFGKQRLAPAPVDEIVNVLQKTYGCEPCAYLGKRQDAKTPSWLFMVPVLHNSTAIGGFSPGMYRKAQERYRAKTGKHFITRRGNGLRLSRLIPLSLGSPGLLLRATGSMLRGGTLRHQVLLIIDAPDHHDGGWDLCEGCPDAMYHEGKLVPSCLLERIKQGEKVMPDA